MNSKTVHVYHSAGVWAVKKEGKPGKTFSTRREAVEAAKKGVRKEGAGQWAVHGKNGELSEYGSYGMPPILDPPKKSRIAKRIAQAVEKMALERVQADSKPPIEHSTKK